MDSGLFRRRTVALVAAYAVALQALLSAFVPIALAASVDPFASLCSHQDGPVPVQPSRHDAPCAALCAAMAQSALGPLPQPAAATAGQPQFFSGIDPARDWVPPRIAPRDNHAPRGPPLV
jgi:hypothetical protein